MNVLEIPDKLIALWKLNCIVYSTIAGRISLNNISKMSFKPHNNNYDDITPLAIKNIETEVKETRRLLSKCSSEITRLKNRNRLTRKSKRNRVELSKLCGSLSIYSLTCLLEKLKQHLKYLARQRKRKKKSLDRRKVNDQFTNNQKDVYKKFKRCYKEGP